MILYITEKNSNNLIGSWKYSGGLKMIEDILIILKVIGKYPDDYICEYPDYLKGYSEVF